LRRIPQLRVHRTDDLQDAGIRIQFARGTIADYNHFRTQSEGPPPRSRPVSVARVPLHSLAKRLSQSTLQALHFRHRCERMSTRMLADSGIEFTEVPPRITPR